MSDFGGFDRELVALDGRLTHAHRRIDAIVGETDNIELFDELAAGWVAGVGTSLSLDPTTPWSSDNGLRITRVSAANLRATAPEQVVPVETSSFRAVAMAITPLLGPTARLMVTFESADRITSAQVDHAPVALDTATWRSVVVEGTAPDWATYIRVDVMIGDVAAASWVVVDGVYLFF